VSGVSAACGSAGTEQLVGLPVGSDMWRKGASNHALSVPAHAVHDAVGNVRPGPRGEPVPCSPVQEMKVTHKNMRTHTRTCAHTPDSRLFDGRDDTAAFLSLAMLPRGWPYSRDLDGMDTWVVHSIENSHPLQRPPAINSASLLQTRHHLHHPGPIVRRVAATARCCR
jgi:hypothetical protein